MTQASVHSVLLLVAALPLVLVAQSASDQIPLAARRLHARAIVVDGHADTPQRMLDTAFDLAIRHEDGNLDIPRMREGGLDAVFLSIWMPGTIGGSTVAARALAQIEAVRNAVRTHPNDLILASTAADVRRAAAEHKIAALLGVEGGHIIHNDLGLLRKYASLGVRYLTLTHTSGTSWADPAGRAPGRGLTAFGREVVRELNRLGVMVDVSHASDKTFADVLEITRAPIIASHSSCRAISNSPRNMTDDMLRAVAKNEGVVMINYNASFLSDEYRAAPRPKAYLNLLGAAERTCARSDQACRTMATERVNQDAMRTGLLPAVTWEKIIDHIDHAVKTAGVDHVGLGSDFDGATMPLGMEDASMLPKITAALLARGYSETDILKILGENLLRVMDRVEKASSALSKGGRD